MKKKILITLVFIISLVLITGCNKNTKNSEYAKYSKMFRDYRSTYESLDGKSLDSTYNKIKHELNQLENISGKSISNFIFKDENNKYKVLNFYFDGDNIVADLLEVKEDKLEVISSDYLTTDFPYLDEFELYVYGVKINDVPTFFLEVNGSSSILADGFYHELRNISVKDDKIVTGSKISYEGSAIYEEEKDSYISKVKRYGLEINTLDDSIYSQNKETTLIFDIKRTHLDEEDNTRISEVIYGKTTFKDYYKNKYLLILKNKKTEVSSDSIKNEFKDDNIGRYSGKDSAGNEIVLEISRKNDGYSYIIEYFEDGSTHSTEDLWGTWDTKNNTFILQNDNINSIAEYKLSNIKYDSNVISFDLKVNKILINEYKDYAIAEGNYSLGKEKK